MQVEYIYKESNDSITATYKHHSVTEYVSGSDLAIKMLTTRRRLMELIEAERYIIQQVIDGIKITDKENHIAVTSIDPNLTAHANKQIAFDALKRITNAE